LQTLTGEMVLDANGEIGRVIELRDTPQKGEADD
jgi:hypothetical protein